MAYEAHSVQLPADLFALTLHPSRPLLAVGLSSGHVYSYTWPSSEEDDEEPTTAPVYTTSWKTRRHKGSCRCISYSGDGELLYTTGTDYLLKAASSSTGQVTSKSAIPTSDGSLDAATALLTLSPHHLLVGTDNGTIHLVDTRLPTSHPKVAATWNSVHDDYITTLAALPAGGATTTGYSRQFIAAGDTTLSHLDVRKPDKVLAKSEDQEDELLCSAFVANAPSRIRDQTEKILTGTSSGVVTVWNKGFWEDHQDRISVSKGTGDSIDSLLDLPTDFEVSGQREHGRYFAAGSGDGKVRIVKMGGKNLVTVMSHSLTAEEAKTKASGGEREIGLVEEGVVALGLDYNGRIVSGGGNMVKIWSEKEVEDPIDDRKRKKEGSSSDSDDAENSDRESASEDDSSDEEKTKRKKRKKKRKGGKGKAKSAGFKNVSSFSGLD